MDKLAPWSPAGRKITSQSLQKTARQFQKKINTDSCLNQHFHFYTGKSHKQGHNPQTTVPCFNREKAGMVRCPQRGEQMYCVHSVELGIGAATLQTNTASQKAQLSPHWDTQNTQSQTECRTATRSWAERRVQLQWVPRRSLERQKTFLEVEGGVSCLTSLPYHQYEKSWEN